MFANFMLVYQGWSKLLPRQSHNNSINHHAIFTFSFDYSKYSRSGTHPLRVTVILAVHKNAGTFRRFCRLPNGKQTHERCCKPSKDGASALLSGEAAHASISVQILRHLKGFLWRGETIDKSTSDVSSSEEYRLLTIGARRTVDGKLGQRVDRRLRLETKLLQRSTQNSQHLQHG